MTLRRHARHFLQPTILGALLATAPLVPGFQAGVGFGFVAPEALAKDGASGGGSSSHGSSSGGTGGGHGGSSGSGGSSDGGSSNSGNGNGGSSGNDDGGRSGGGGGGDDHAGRAREGEDTAPATSVGGGSATGGAVRTVKVERTPSGIEVVYSNGIKEEISNGRFESKNAAGQTVSERPATQRDVARLETNARNSGMAPIPGANAPGGQAVRIETAGGAVEVTYATGWREELAGGRYELKDPNNNTVVQRAATPADIRRLQALAGG